jgi:hypothetical protein
MNIPSAMQRCNHLHRKKGELGDVEVLAPQQPMHVVEDYREITIIFQVKVLLGDPLMRTSPRWTHRRYGLLQVAIRPQLSCHVTLGFSRHVVTVSVITLSYDIETGRS